jgi:alkanesulfonate monooxygenase SsuD/methylene tetrahydromethanopterin reductase-like flavin-dependent oxidoreductase (luciferase family)
MAYPSLGFGVHGDLEPEIVADVAQRAEQRGYQSFWISHPVSGPALAPLARAASRTRAIKLGVGVVPLSHASPQDIVDAVRRLDLPIDRLLLGLGSGNVSKPLSAIRAAAAALRAALPAALVIGALGPRMCELAGQEGDGLLLTLVSPELAMAGGVLAARAARERGRPAPLTYTYVRVAVGTDAARRVEDEVCRYRQYPAFARHLDMVGVASSQLGIAATSEATLRHGLLPWRSAVDVVVIRPVRRTTVIEMLDLVDVTARLVS